MYAYEREATDSFKSDSSYSFRSERIEDSSDSFSDAGQNNNKVEQDFISLKRKNALRNQFGFRIANNAQNAPKQEDLSFIKL